MPVFLQRARTAGHDVRVEIDRIDRVRDGDFIVGAEDFLDVAAVALGTVADEDLIFVDLDSALRVVVLDDRFRQEGIALLRAIATEGFGFCHLIDSLVHGLDAGSRQRLGNIADAETDDIRIRMRLLECLDPAGDFCEEIAAREFQIVVINSCHKQNAPLK